MSRRAFGTEMALDLAVNLIPLSILVFFVVLFAAYDPWGFDPLHSTIQFAILFAMIVALAIVTVVSARRIEGL